MSKIIVDQIQKNGGTALTVPSADGTANQPVVTNGSGVLAFSPLAMPAADGTANYPVKTDGSGQLGFAPYALPATDGTASQTIATNGSGVLGWASAPSGAPTENDITIGSVVTSSARQNVYSTGEWSSSGSWTTHYMNTMTTNASAVQSWNAFLGDGYPTGTSQHFFSGDADGQRQRESMYANNQRMGHSYRDFYYNDNASTGHDYAGVTWRVMPIRNNGASDINVTIAAQLSCGDNSYGGSCTAVYHPSSASAASGTSVDYTSANGGTWTDISTRTSGSDSYSAGGTITVPANTTVLIMAISCHRYHTTYRYKDTNFFKGLDTLFSNADILCDSRMLDALQRGRSPSNTYTTAHPYELYNWCASNHGNRQENLDELRNN